MSILRLFMRWCGTIMMKIFLKGGRTVKKTSKKPRKRRRAWLLLLLLPLVLLAVAITAAVCVLTPYAEERMDMSLLSLPAVNRPATLYARDPDLRAEREGELSPAPDSVLAQPEKRIFVSIEEMPVHLLDAFVAIEDKRFYRHRGVDVLRTGRAVLGYLTGNATFGGSTITQQLVKNLTGHDENTPDRKLREIFLALDLERHADKATVLECYLNIINLADGCRGVGAAAMRYFSKSPAELTLCECATLAAITQNPAKYNPIKHPHAAVERRDIILHAMHEQGYITSETLSAALATPLVLAPTSLSVDTGEGACSWYADLVVSDVIRDLCDRLGYSRATASELVYAGGLSIETAMDRDLQSIVEEYYANLEHFPVGTDGRPQSAFILLDPDTGDILAVAGAVGEKTGDRLQSYATDTYRPAGSCIKPLSLYAPAIQEGLVTWATLFEDAPITERNGEPWPHNADGLYRGHITLGTSLSQSVNTTAVRLLELVGEDTAMHYLRDRFGMTSLLASADRTVSSLALGQQSRGVTLRELTAAYTAFPSGILRKAVSYHRVLDREGNVLLENPRDGGREALSPATASLMTRLLETVTAEGTASRYITLSETLGVATAGKTGTTQNNCDRRFVGMTPRLLGGVWMGYDYPRELRGIAGNPCVQIWDDLLTLCEQAYRGSPARQFFDLPAELTEADFCPLTGGLHDPYDEVASDASAPTEHGYFIPGTEPNSLCTQHREDLIPTHPDHLADPDRIPLFPGEILTEIENESESGIEHGNAPPAPLPPWYSRIFGRLAGKERHKK